MMLTTTLLVFYVLAVIYPSPSKERESMQVLWDRIANGEKAEAAYDAISDVFGSNVCYVRKSLKFGSRRV